MDYSTFHLRMQLFFVRHFFVRQLTNAVGWRIMAHMTGGAQAKANFRGTNSEQILFYEGNISQSALEHALATLRLPLETRAVVRRVRAVLVELVQNIMRHGLRTDEGTVQGSFSVGTSSDAVTVRTTNVVSTLAAARARALVKDIKRLSHEELRMRYRRQQRLKTGGRGVGLGLLDAACRAGGRIQAACASINRDRTMLIITVELQKEEGPHATLQD